MQSLVSILLGVCGAGLVALVLWGRRTLWPSHGTRGVVADAGSVVALALLIAVILIGRIVWVRAYNGQAAFEYISQVVAQQQAQQKK